MSRALLMGLRVLALSWVLPAALACDNSSPGPGEGCVASGGECSAGVVCGESLPYPCPGQATCCVARAPAQPGDAGGRD